MQISIRHQLSVAVGEGVARAVQHLLLTPQTSPVQSVREWQIDAPGMDGATGFIDAFGNRAHLASQTRPEAELTIRAAGIVETHDLNGVVGRLERDPVPALFRRVTPLTRAAGGIVSRFRSAPRHGKDRIALLHALMERVGEAVAEQGQDGQSQTQAQAQEGQSQRQGGVAGTPGAADYAHGFIGAARALGIPARYVTGYLSPDDGRPATFHAWAEAWDDGLGWIGFDAMLNLCPAEQHVRVASGLDALSTAPVRSVPMVGTPQVLAVQMDVAQ